MIDEEEDWYVHLLSEEARAGLLLYRERKKQEASKRKKPAKSKDRDKPKDEDSFGD